MRARWLRFPALGALLGITVILAATLSADSGPEHQTLQTRPVPLGTSGGNINDRSTAFCCSGTLGALVQNATTQFILSNNHVLARTNKASVGDDIIQPGLIDQIPVCFRDANDAVADLSDWEPILFTKGTTNVVDAAIAQVRGGAVKTDGAILDIGIIGSAPVPAAINQPVKKSGRTTGLTTGVVAAVNVTISVKYGSVCGGGRGTARFTNQIRITPGSFSAGGDSGSLIVQNVATNPGALGLLFAGGSNDTFANPIQDVLAAFPGVTMVGTTSSGWSPLWKWVARLLPETLIAHAAQPGQRPIDPASQAAATQAKERHEQAIMRIQGVVGIGVGASDVVPGEAVVEVYVEKATPAVRAAIPAQLDNVPVKVVETGEITARTDSCPLDR
jgi:hypothetical protein